MNISEPPSLRSFQARIRESLLGTRSDDDAAIDRGLRVVGTWLNDNGDTANPLGAVLADLRAYAAHAGLDFTTGDDLVSPADDQLAFGLAASGNALPALGWKVSLNNLTQRSRKPVEDAGEGVERATRSRVDASSALCWAAAPPASAAYLSSASLFTTPFLHKPRRRPGPGQPGWLPRGGSPGQVAGRAAS